MSSKAKAPIDLGLQPIASQSIAVLMAAPVHLMANTVAGRNCILSRRFHVSILHTPWAARRSQLPTPWRRSSKVKAARQQQHTSNMMRPLKQQGEEPANALALLHARVLALWSPPFTRTCLPLQ